MNVIYWLIIGALAGWIASMIMKTNAEQGMLMDIVVGIIGAVIGGWVFSLLGISAGGSIIGSLVTAVVGAVILLALIRVFRRG